MNIRRSVCSEIDILAMSITFVREKVNVFIEFN